MKKLLLVLFFSASAFAETVSVGSLPIGRKLFVTIASTIIDDSRPATASAGTRGNPSASYFA